ncbi:MAG: protein kinase [Eubacteriales bacterium]|nr:protein kinase [Eubacteriales bacterium]
MNRGNVKTDVDVFNTQYAAFLKDDVSISIPKEITTKYDLVSCLSLGALSETYEVRAKADGRKQILKIFDLTHGGTRREDLVLKGLDHPHIPKLIDSVVAMGKVYIVREYFEGYTLSEPVSAGHRFTYKETIEIAKKLCDILLYLHERPQPVIYRDIKPQNIILTPDGDVKLVDFDIARTFSATAYTDTQYYGTKEFSPPEQFGYAQTDERTDVYALGVLMVYMLTGSADLGGIPRIDNKHMKKLLETCTQFSPKDRYSGMRTLKKNLGGIQKKSRGKVKKTAIALLMAAGCLAAGFLAGVYYESNREHRAAYGDPAGSVVSFESALIDKAVRLALGKDADEPVYYQELGNVEKVSIWGGDAYAGEEELKLGYDAGFSNVSVYFGGYDSGSAPVTRGDISSLEEISLLANLKELDVVMQGITDISALEGLSLERLNIAGNQVSDLSPLEDMQTLVSLNIDYNPVSDISALSSLDYLVELSASDTLIEDVSPLGGLYHLEYLYINDARVSDVSVLADLKLVNCFLQNNDIEDISALEGVDNLNVSGNPAAE